MAFRQFLYGPASDKKTALDWLRQRDVLDRKLFSRSLLIVRAPRAMPGCTRPQRTENQCGNARLHVSSEACAKVAIITWAVIIHSTEKRKHLLHYG